MKTINPLTNIAITLSGGGYRAAAFHLGVLSYLNHLKLGDKNVLSQVKMLSTISGGTITGVKYALSYVQSDAFQNYDPQAFKVFYDEFYLFLKEDTLMKKAFDLVSTEDNWTDYGQKQKNLINAFAVVYDNALLNKQKFDTIYQYVQGKDVQFMFNATDIDNVLPFRFQTEGDFGNGKYDVKKEDFGQIRLGDIVAASSCFPGGFEPLLFPNDFSDTLTQKYSRVSLMDGGVVDNQGIDSVETAEERYMKKQKEPFIGTFIVSDVALKLNPFTDDSFEQRKPSGLLSLSIDKLNIILIVLTVLSVAGAYWLRSTWYLYSIPFLIGLLSLAGLFIFYKFQKLIKNKVTSLVGQKDPAFLDDLSVLSRVNLGTLLELLRVRLDSVFHLNDSVFLRRMRQMNINRLFKNNDYYFRNVITTIYELADKKDLCSPALRAQIDMANTMGTTLWFSDAQKKDDAMLKALISTGQATVCFNLLKYLQDIKKRDFYQDISNDYKALLAATEAALTADCKNFNDNPLWLV